MLFVYIYLIEIGIVGSNGFLDNDFFRRVNVFVGQNGQYCIKQGVDGNEKVLFYRDLKVVSVDFCNEFLMY